MTSTTLMRVKFKNEIVDMKFEDLYRMYKRQVYRNIKKQVGNELVAEELTNDAFVKLHANIDKYSTEEGAIVTWLYAIATNCAIDYIRKKQLETNSIEEIFPDWASDESEDRKERLVQLIDNGSNPESQMIQEETRKKLYQNYESLSTIEQTISGLHYFDGLSYDEIAAELNIPLGTVKAKLHNARTVLMGAFPKEMRKLATIER